MKKIKFPRYLHRNRLFYKWEVDQIFVFAGVFFGLFYVFGFFLMFNLFLAFVLSIISAIKMTKIYNKTIKLASPGFLQHMLYDIGLYKPKRLSEDDIEIPYGFERKFED